MWGTALVSSTEGLKVNVAGVAVQGSRCIEATDGFSGKQVAKVRLRVPNPNEWRSVCS